MVKISITKGKKEGSAQATITIPVDIMKLKGWTDGSELYFTPFLKEPNDRITEDTPIILKEIKKEVKKEEKK